MKITTSDCVDCDLPCIQESCRYYKVDRYLCDECNEETELYYFDNQELCAECVLNRLEKIEGSFY